MPPSPPVRVSPSQMQAGARVANIQQANALGVAQQNANAEDESFGFSVLRKTVMQVLSPLTYGTIGVAFFSVVIGAMAKMEGAWAKGAAELIKLAPVNANAFLDKGGLITSEAAGTLLMAGAAMGVVGVGAALISNAISTQLECTARERAKCHHKAPEQAPQVIIVPVGVEVSQHAHAHQANEQEANSSAQSSSAANIKRQLTNGYARLIDRQQLESALQPTQLG